jgi:hypothetical protein
MGRGIVTEDIIKNIQAMQYHYNKMVEAYEKLPTLTPMRKVIIDDALIVIGATMDGVYNELKDYGEQI